MNLETAELIESLREEIRAVASPWKTREGAAAYLGCDPTAIDKLSAAGKIKPKYLATSPRYLREDLDKLLRDRKKPLHEILSESKQP